MRRIMMMAAWLLAAAAAWGQDAAPRVLVTTEAGTARQLLGDDLYEVESLVVRGPINQDDVTDLWRASRKGKLRELDMGQADFPNEIFHTGAFWVDDDGTEIPYRDGYSYILKRVVVPPGIKEITGGLDCGLVEEVRLPESVRSIGIYTFLSCRYLKTINLPDGLEEIEWGAFGHTLSLHEINIPSSIKTIRRAAFCNSRIESVVISGDLEYIGLQAFSLCRNLREVDLAGCPRLRFDEEMQFYDSGIERLRLPEGLEVIPAGMAGSCENLTDVNIPSTVREIRGDAFAGCSLSGTMVLPEGLETIEYRAFRNNDFSTVALPSTLKTIDYTAFNRAAELYCAAPVPPAWGSYGQGVGWLWPMAEATALEPSLAAETPVYVPRGRAAAYRAAPGWSHFTDIRETDTFPRAGTSEIAAADPAVNVTALPGCLVIRGAEGDATPYAVYTPAGVLAAAGMAAGAETRVPLTPGLYIVTAGSESVKVAVP